LTVGGCSNPTVASIIQGHFTTKDSNHGRPVYKKESAPGSVSVLIYYWDERDGPNFSGWWFGPKVGGDQVWAYNNQRSSAAPPSSGWRVPWDGLVDDSLRVAPSQSGGGGGGGGGGGHRGELRGDPRGDARGDARVAPNSAPSRSRREDDDRRLVREDDDRRRQEHVLKDEDRRRQETVREEQRRREEDERRRRRKEEEDRTRRDEEVRQRREDEERRRRHEEDKRRREEEERRRRQKEEEDRRREEERRRREEETRKKEQAAALAVRKVIQRVRIATPESYDALRGEMEECLKMNVSAMGTQAQKVAEEAEQTLRQAQRRIEELILQREEEERKRLEEEKRKREEAERVDVLMKQAAERLRAAEESVADAADAAKDLSQFSAEAAPEAMKGSATAAVVAVEAARAGLDKALVWMSEKHKELTENRANRSSVMEWTDMSNRLDASRKSLDRMADKAEQVRERAERKAAALAQEQERRSRFEKHDLDQDGTLSREEVVAFAKAAHSFEVTEEVLEKILAVLEPVTFDKFRMLHQKVAIAKLESQARVRRAEEEERKRVLAEQRQAVQKILDETDAILATAEENVNMAEYEAKPLTRDYDQGADEMKAIAGTAQNLVSKALEESEAAAAKLLKVEADCAANVDLRDYAKRDIPRLFSRQERTQGRGARVEATIKKALERAVQKANAEIDQKLTECVAAVHRRVASAEKTRDELFDEAAGGAEALSSEKFAAFVKGLDDLKLGDGQAERLFEHVALEGAALSKERFVDVSRLFYKCVKSTVCSEDIAIKSKTARRLEVGEILEALGGAKMEESVGLLRVRCRATRDDVVGWVTVQGNQGTPFLLQDGNFFVHGSKKPAADEPAADADAGVEGEVAAVAAEADAEMPAAAEAAAPAADAETPAAAEADEADGAAAAERVEEQKAGAAEEAPEGKEQEEKTEEDAKPVVDPQPQEALKKEEEKAENGEEAKEGEAAKEGEEAKEVEEAKEGEATEEKPAE